MGPFLAQLVIGTVKDPAQAARQILALRLPLPALWALLGLVAIINAGLFTLTNLLMPPPGGLPMVFASPLIFCAVVAGGVIVSAGGITVFGRFFGGSGGFEGIFALLIWLQALRALVQGIVLVLMFIAPGMAAFVVFAAGLYGFWVLLHFINIALQLTSLWRALTVLVASTVAIILALVMVLTMLGLGTMGIPSNV